MEPISVNLVGNHSWHLWMVLCDLFRNYEIGISMALESYVGLDLSLTGTGVCVRGDELKVETIKTVPKNFDNDLDRMLFIVKSIMGKIPSNVKLICVEDFFTPAKSFQIGAAISLAMLGALVRAEMYKAGLPFVVISPNQLKKYVTGKGSGQKSLILRETYKRWNVDAKDDNQADAVVLSYIAEGLIEGVKEDTPKFQEEVIRTVRKDRPRYNVHEDWAKEPLA
jgi:Holliday junction resolvasome RuvABC endonuclease subunit